MSVERFGPYSLQRWVGRVQGQSELAWEIEAGNKVHIAVYEPEETVLREFSREEVLGFVDALMEAVRHVSE